MSKSQHNLEYTIKLAHLDVDEKHKTKYIKQLENVLDYMKTLNDLDLKNISSSALYENEATLLREDKVKPFENINLEKNAPSLEEHSFQVPKILTDE
ncbi:Asp-tRNA(Asn)/Glu-tRNA(Gln) amidotransferase subunit GatC [Candidatus Margulisiibacteriota bacterium]